MVVIGGFDNKISNWYSKDNTSNEGRKLKQFSQHGVYIKKLMN